VVIVGCLTIDVCSTRDEELDRAQMTGSGSLESSVY
jgi:hypothetical protein